MRIEVVTLFPELVDGASRYGVTGRARRDSPLPFGPWLLLGALLAVVVAG